MRRQAGGKIFCLHHAWEPAAQYYPYLFSDDPPFTLSPSGLLRFSFPAVCYGWQWRAQTSHMPR